MRTLFKIFLIFFIISIAPAHADINNGLVGWWKLDDGSGTSAIDSSGNAYTGTLVNSPAWVSQCKKSGCLNMNASGSGYVTLPNVGVSAGSARSISAWIYPTAASGIRTIVRWGSSSNEGGCGLSFNVNTKDIYFGFNNDDWYTSNNVAPLNQWTHVVFTYAGGTTSSATVKIYINGVSQVLSKAGVMNSPNTANSNYAIGEDIVTTGRAFTGLIDDVRIYNRALTANEANDLYIPGAVVRNAVISNGKINQ